MRPNRQTAIPRRGPLRPAIEPIHVEELLAGAGMSGFLGILQTPVVVPHASDALAHLTAPALPQQGMQLFFCLASRMESIRGRLGQQQELLHEVVEVARRMSASAERLALRMTSFAG